MAKKKEPSIQDTVTYFKSIIDRIGAGDIVYQNRIMLYNNGKCSILITADQTLWNELTNDETFKTKLSEVSPFDKEKIGLLNLGEEIGSWIDLDIDELNSGKVIHIKIEGYDYNIAICKDSLPLKLKKAEMNNISYQLTTMQNQNCINKVLKLRKVFPGLVDDSSFSVMSVFLIV